jgi:hypothetical protein
MKQGLSSQMEVLAAMAKAGEIRVETLEQSGQWFKREYPLTPATAVVAMDDWKGQGRKTVWYNSRFYRMNVLWEKGTFFIRDIHCFDERIISPTHETALKASALTYETLPIVDWASWSRSNKDAGMWPVLVGTGGEESKMQSEGAPAVREVSGSELSIQQPLKGGGSFAIVCAEEKITFASVDGQGKPQKWAIKIVGGAPLKAAAREVGAAGVTYSHAGVEYRLRLADSAGSCSRLDDGSIKFVPNTEGRITIKFDVSSMAEDSRK